MFVCIREVDSSQDLYKIYYHDEKMSDCFCINFENEKTVGPVASNISRLIEDHFVGINIKYQLKDLLNILLNYKDMLDIKKHNIVNKDFYTGYIDVYTPVEFSKIIKMDKEELFNNIIVNLNTDISIKDEIRKFIKKYYVFLKNDAENIIMKELKHNIALNQLFYAYNNYSIYLSPKKDSELKLFLNFENEMKEAEIKYIISVFEDNISFSTLSLDRYIFPIYDKYTSLGFSYTFTKDTIYNRINKCISLMKTIFEKINL